MDIQGKIINFLGDSITEGVGVEDINNNRYDNVIKKKASLAGVNNYGISGTRIAHQTQPSEKPRYDLCFCGRAYNMYSEADIIVVYGGVNDYIHGDAPFGSLTDKTPSTFCGGVEFLMNILSELYPKSQLIFLTPAHSCYADTDESKPSNRAVKLNDAKPLKAYVDVIEKKGTEHGIPVLNLYEKLPINPNNPQDKEKYTSDGLHFNDAGHAVIADLIIDFLRNEV